MIYLYKNYSKKLHRGFFFGLCLTYIFTARFFIEYTKEVQEASRPLSHSTWTAAVDTVCRNRHIVYERREMDDMAGTESMIPNTR